MLRPQAIFLLCLTLIPFTETALGSEKSQYFDSDGVKIHFVDKGEGEPVVLIHGFAASYQANWGLPGIFDALAKEFRVIALDVRGHGKSEKPHGVDKYGVNTVEDVVRLLDHLQIQRAHIVGYSMGGFMTTKLLAQYPDRVASAVVGAAGWSAHPEERLKLLDEIGDSLEAGTGIAPLLRALTPEGQPQRSDAEMMLANQMLMLMNDARALSCVIRGMRSLIVERVQLENNRVPTLAVVGSIDPLKDGVDEMEQVMKNLHVEVIDGADHMTAVGNPKLLGSIVAHLKNNSLAPATADASN